MLYSRYIPFFESYWNASVTAVVWVPIVAGLNRGKSKDMPCSLLGADHCLSENHNKINASCHWFGMFVRTLIGCIRASKVDQYRIILQSLVVMALCKKGASLLSLSLDSRYWRDFTNELCERCWILRLTDVGSAGNRVATTDIATSQKTAHAFSIGKASCLDNLIQAHWAQLVRTCLLVIMNAECLQSHSFIVPGILHLTFSGCSSSAHFSADLCTPWKRKKCEKMYWQQ